MLDGSGRGLDFDFLIIGNSIDQVIVLRRDADFVDSISRTGSERGFCLGVILAKANWNASKGLVIGGVFWVTNDGDIVEDVTDNMRKCYVKEKNVLRIVCCIIVPWQNDISICL